MELLNEDKRQRFIVGDIDSKFIEGTIDVLNFRVRGMGMVFRTWVHQRAPLNSQWPILENGGTDFHHCTSSHDMTTINLLMNSLGLTCEWLIGSAIEEGNMSQRDMGK